VNGLGLLPLLRCPATGSPLALAGGSLSTPDGARVYPIVDGVPILIARERSLFDPADYGQTPRASLRGRVRRLPKQLALGLLALLPTIGRTCSVCSRCSAPVRRPGRQSGSSWSEGASSGWEWRHC
jgi:uncharacterized protein YbaR (Trm112 family)